MTHLREQGLVETVRIPGTRDHAVGLTAAGARFLRGARPNVRPTPLVLPQPVDYRPSITIEPGKRGGKPCIRGLRITVYDVLEYLSPGMSVEDIVSDFQDLTADDVRACLAFAADREKRLVKVPA